MDQVVRASVVHELIANLIQSAADKLLSTQCSDYESYMRLFALHAAASTLRYEFNELLTERLKNEEE